MLLLMSLLVWGSVATTRSEWPRHSADASAVVQRLARLEMKMDRALAKLDGFMDVPSNFHWMDKDTDQSMTMKINEAMDHLLRKILEKQREDKEQIFQLIHDLIMKKNREDKEFWMKDMTSEDKVTGKMNEFMDKMDSLKKQVDDSRIRIIRRLGKIEQKLEENKDIGMTKPTSITKKSPEGFSSYMSERQDPFQESAMSPSSLTHHCKDLGVKLGNLAYVVDHRLLYAINGIHKDIRQGNEIAKETRDIVGSLESKMMSPIPEMTTPSTMMDKPMPERMKTESKMSGDEPEDSRRPSQLMAFGLEMMGKGILLLAKQAQNNDNPSIIAHDDSTRPNSCAQVFKQGNTKSGIYSIWPKAPGMMAKQIQAYCDMDTSGGGWTVFQRRGLFGGKQENFSVPWANYKKGFGKATRDFWLGNDALHALTAQEPVRLRIELEAWDNDTGYAEYSEFKVSDENDLYRIRVGGYMGSVQDAMTYHNGSAFSTIDRNNADHISRNCHIGEGQGGGWWYKNCYYAKLNSPYYPHGNVGRSEGIVWRVWKGFMYSLKATEMKVRPLCFPHEPPCPQQMTSMNSTANPM